MIMSFIKWLITIPELQIAFAGIIAFFSTIIYTKHNTRKQERLRNENHNLKQKELLRQRLREKSIKAKADSDNAVSYNDISELRNRRKKDPNNRNKRGN